MTKYGLFCHDIMHLIKNNNTHIVVNDSRCPIPKVEGKKKPYNARGVKRNSRTRQFQNITVQPINLILHTVDHNILQNLPILREYVSMAEEIYGPSVPHFKGKTVRHNTQHLEPIMIMNAPKAILDKYKKVTLWCDLTHINSIGFLNTISQHIMFSILIMIKNRKLKNIEDGIKQVNKL